MGNICHHNPHILQGDTAISGDPVVDLVENKIIEQLDPSWSLEKQFQEVAPEGSTLLKTKPAIGSAAAQLTKNNTKLKINTNPMDIQTLDLKDAALQLPSRDVCVGNWAKDKKMYKKAEIFLQSGGYFKGEIKKSEPVFGLLIHPNGDYYHGSFKDFNASGSGHFVTKDGYEYEGNWENDKMHHPHSIIDKKASYKKENVFQYNGCYENGQKSGWGSLQVNNVFKYEGEFKCDEIHGYGKLMFLDGSERFFSGNFQNNKKEGKGKFSWPKLKAEYEGEYKADMKQGKGKMTFWNGAIYEGDFSLDKMHGEGILTLLGERKGLKVKFNQGKFYESKKDDNSENSILLLTQDDLFQLEMDDYDESLPQNF